MFTFIFGLVALLLGFLIYGKIAERIYGIKPDAVTPAYKVNDGVDYVPMSKWKCFLFHLINIAGTGPIFGAIAGALFGPAAFLWIVFGCIFAGAVHDYMISMMSLRNGGCHVGDLVGKYLGKNAKFAMRGFSLVLMIFVGAVFTTSPAMVLQTLFAPGNVQFYRIVIAVIICYYLIATVIPVDKIIGRIYPLFGAVMIFMAVSMMFFIFFSGDFKNIPEFAFQNMRPDSGTNMLAKIFPFLFITIACGAISGFHATQGPITARCTKNEKEGRMIFYGAMIMEGVIAMIWAAVTMGHFQVVGVETAVAAPVIVTRSAMAYLGTVDGALAVIGVALFPITTGDTAFRGARLIIADALKFDQKSIKNRFILCIPLFTVGVLLTLFSIQSAANFNIMWRYFAWSNQTLATFGLWTACVYLAKAGKNYWITLVPATFMTSVVTTYFFTARECLGPMITGMTGSTDTTYAIGLCVGLGLAAVLFIMFMTQVAIKQKGTLQE